MCRSTVTFGKLTDLQPSQRPTLIHSLLFSLRWCARMVSGAIKRLTNSCNQHRNVFSTYEEVNKRLQAPQGGPQQRDPALSRGEQAEVTDPVLLLTARWHPCNEASRTSVAPGHLRMTAEELADWHRRPPHRTSQGTVSGCNVQAGHCAGPHAAGHRGVSHRH